MIVLILNHFALEKAFITCCNYLLEHKLKRAQGPGQTHHQLAIGHNIKSQHPDLYWYQRLVGTE